MPEEKLKAGLLLLPDELKTPKAEHGIGMVPFKGEGRPFAMTGRAMKVTPPRHGAVIAAPVQLEDDPERVAAWRGAVAAALLCDTWQSDTALRVVTAEPTSSPFVKAALEASDRDTLRLIVL